VDIDAPPRRRRAHGGPEFLSKSHDHHEIRMSSGEPGQAVWIVDVLKFSDLQPEGLGMRSHVRDSRLAPTPRWPGWLCAERDFMPFAEQRVQTWTRKGS
jgi:hypothetical protein